MQYIICLWNLFSISSELVDVNIHNSVIHYVFIQVNGQNVETKSRDDIAEIIKHSSDSLTLKVQPIQELIELSVRPNRDGTSTDIPEDAARSSTLRKTGSLKYKPGVSMFTSWSCVCIGWPMGPDNGLTYQGSGFYTEMV